MHYSSEKMRQHILMVSILILHCMFAHKTTTNPYIGSQPIGGTFEDLVKGGLYVDNTNFIKDLLHEENLAKVTLITYPRRFGKSINIQMLSDYFQISVDDTGKRTKSSKADLFEKLDVDNDEILKKSFKGQYPVLKISLGGVSGESYTKMKETFISNVLRDPSSGVYRHHGYMMNVLEKRLETDNLSDVKRRRLTNFLNYFKKLGLAPLHEITVDEVESSFRMFASMLHDEFGMKVFIFIDEYDHAINDAFFKYNSPDQTLIKMFFHNLFLLTFKEGVEVLKLGVITGVLKIAKEDLFTSLSNVAECNMLHNRYFRYYGFTKKNVDYLCTKRGGISSDLKDSAEHYYDGYRVSPALEIPIFNPWAISLFLQNRAIGPYFEKSGSLAMFLPIFSHPVIWQDLLGCVNGETVLANLDFLSVTIAEFSKLQEMTNPQHKVTESDRNTFYKLLLSTGYLTLDFKQNAGKPLELLGTAAFLRVPNRLLKMELSSILVANDPKGELSCSGAYQAAANDILEMFYAKNLNDAVESFERSFKNILDGYGAFTLLKPYEILNANETHIYFTEDVIHSIVNNLGLSVNSRYIDMEIPPIKGKGGADLIIFFAELKKVLVFKFKIYKHPATKKKGLSTLAKRALKQAKQYARLFHDTVFQIQHVMYVGIAVSLDKIILSETAEQDVEK